MEYFFINTDASSFSGPHNLDVWFERNLAFTGGPKKFGEQLSKLSPGDICLMYDNGQGIVAVGRVLNKWNGKENPNPIYYDGDDPEYSINVHWFIDLRGYQINVADVIKKVGYQPRGAVRRIVKRKEEIASLVDKFSAKQKFVPPDEIEQPETYHEGALVTITVNAYERNIKARRKCIEHWGVLCAVCKMNFFENYGPLGQGYIHVHHLIPLSEIANKYKVDPINEMRPVCPNCHAMLHKKNPPYSIAELQKLINGKANKRLQRTDYSHR